MADENLTEQEKKERAMDNWDSALSGVKDTIENLSVCPRKS